MKSKTYSRDPHAGLTSQAAVQRIGNRYDMVLIAANRMRELNRGDAALVDGSHGPAVTALREIEAGLVAHDYLYRKPVESTSRRPNRYHTKGN